MSINATNPFASIKPKMAEAGLQTGVDLQTKKPQQGQPEEKMYGMANPFQGEAFKGFQVPQSNGAHNSFRPEGPLGDNAIQAANGAELGRNLFAFA
jgi:hypothetical protein